MSYVGRFAPSPTGLLHIGSLLTAVASYADARANHGKWLLRIEDLDPPREMAGASTHILHTLAHFGFEWDGDVVYQHQRHALYRAALDKLIEQNQAYPCTCSRKQWQSVAKMGADGLVYNGACAAKTTFRLPENQAVAWRLRTQNQIIEFEDKIIGKYAQNVAQDIGDFVLLRADGHWAYQLAVVVDDAAQGVSHVVRGQDLLVSTPRQIFLQGCLNLPTPQYAHLPLLLNHLGQKWSKQTLAPALDWSACEQLLRQVLAYLNVPPCPAVDTPRDVLNWAVANWQIERVPKSGIVTEKT